MAQQSQLELAQQLLDQAGIKYELVPGGKHAKLRWRLGNRVITYVCSRTPSDHRAWLNCRAKVRRMIRETLAGCCPNESRTMEGGCRNCGDPCI